MQRFNWIVVAGLVVIAGCSDNPSAPVSANVGGVSTIVSLDQSVRVTTNADAGPGSFRSAVLAANGDAGIAAIKFDKDLGTILLESPVTFTGPQALEIKGADGDISGASLAAGEDAFVADGGGDLTISRLTVRNAPGVGIKILVPSTKTGIVSVTLDNVIMRSNGEQGALINDQSGYLIDPESVSSDGSEAGLRVRVKGSSFLDNGFGSIDQDGLRVNEGGLGDLDAVIVHTKVIANGGDGIELDERGAGSAIFTVEHSQLDRNGSFSSLDYDDGIDVDEAGDGAIDATFNHVTVNGNFEQGVDLNENDAGELRVFMNKVEASDNAEEGVEFEEDDDFAGGGDIIALLKSVTTLRNGANDGDAGLKIREKGDGNISAEIEKPVSSDNLIGGILIREDGAGNLDATVENAIASGNNGSGIKFDENSTGNLAGRVLKATASGNSGAGIAAEQALSGTGLIQIRHLTAIGNTEGAVKNDAGVTVEYIN